MRPDPRRATPADAPRLAASRRAMLDEMTPADAEAHAGLVPEWERFFEEHVRAGTVRMFLVESGGALAAVGGYVLVPHPSKPDDPAERRGFVINVWTDPAHRSRGLARAVMEAVVADARAAGVRRLDLRSSEAARPLYASMGFAPVETLRLNLT